MEAADVVGLPPGFKFDPEDDELVAHFLLPRLQGQRLPLDGIILEDDPLSAPPWKLLDTHRRKEDAFFFAAGQQKSGKGSRQKRTCTGGGCWEGQKVCVDGENLRVPGSGMEIGWRKYALNFHADGERGSTGWVMHEYAVTAPADLASSPLRLYRIRFSGHGKKRKRGTQDSGGDDGGARAAPRRAMAEAALPLLEEYPSASQPVCPSVVVVDLVDDDDGSDLGAGAVPEATSSDQGSSGVMDFSSFLDFEIPDNIDELLSSIDDFILPAAVGSGVTATADGAAPTTIESSAAPAGTSSSDQGSTVDDDLFLNFGQLEDIADLLQTFNYDDFSVSDP